MITTAGHSSRRGVIRICKLKKDRQHNGQKNQRLSRACIVHLVIKRTNWSYVKTMSCSGNHLGIDRKSKMAATTGHNINTGPYGENTEIYSSLKLLH
jgi:hypothetical protein